MVLRNRVTTRHFAATLIRSCSRMIFDTAAAISGVSPATMWARAGVSTASERSQSRSSPTVIAARSEEHTSELQSRFDLVCRLLLEKKNALAVSRSRLGAVAEATA